MPDESNIQRIKDYLAQHRSQYTLPVLREQLVAAGYAPEDIDAAIAQLGATPVLDASSTDQEIVAASQEPSAPTDNLAPSNNTEIVRMADYLRQHAGKYSLDALRAQLVAAGRPPALVEAAVAQFQAKQPQPQPRRRLLTIALAILNTVLIPLVAYLLALLFSNSDVVIDNAIVTAIGLLFAELVAGLVLLFPRRTTWLGKSLLLSVAISVVLTVILIIVGVILLAGTCLVMLRNL